MILGSKGQICTLLGISQKLFLRVFNIFCMLVIDYEWLRLIRSVFNFGQYWVWFCGQKIKFLPFWPYLWNCFCHFFSFLHDNNRPRKIQINIKYFQIWPILSLNLESNCQFFIVLVMSWEQKQYKTPQHLPFNQDQLIYYLHHISCRSISRGSVGHGPSSNKIFVSFNFLCSLYI